MRPLTYHIAIDGREGLDFHLGAAVHDLEHELIAASVASIKLEDLVDDVPLSGK